MVRCLVIFMLFCFVTVAEVNPSSLYERIGRYDAISQIVDEYLKGIRSDPQFARFSGRGPDSLIKAKQLLKDQLCSLTGGPCVHIGRDMKRPIRVSESLTKNGRATCDT